MAYVAIAGIAPQYENYPNWWLKAYEQGTTTPLAMALDADGVTTVSKLVLDLNGFINTDGNAKVIPYLDEAYDLWLIPTEADANANDLTNAVQVADNIDNFIRTVSFANYDDLRAVGNASLVDGQVITVTDEGIAGQGVLRNIVGHGVTDNGVTIIVIDANWYWERIIKQITSTLLSDANATLTAGQMIAGECTISPTLERVKTIDTAFNIISAMGGSADNISFDFTFINSSSSKVTIAPNSGVNLVGSMSVIKGAATFRVRRLSPTSVSVTRLETGVLTSIDDLGMAPNPVVNIDSITSTGFITTSAASMGTFPSGSPKVGVLTSIARTSTFVSQTLHDFIPDQIFTRIITNGTPAAWKRLDEPSPTKAWVLFNGGGTVSILGSSNISSITDRGVGLYTINLSTPMPNTNYAVSGYASRGGVGASVVVMGDTSVTRTTSAIPIQVRGVNNAAFDAGEISLVVTGD